MVGRISRLTDQVRARTGERPVVFGDSTGVGQPVVDILQERAHETRIVPVYFTHGDRRTKDSGGIKLGKAFLVSRLQSLLQTGRVDENAHDRHGAFRAGTHDDLVTALGLAVQVDDFSLGGVLPSIPGW